MKRNKLMRITGIILSIAIFLVSLPLSAFAFDFSSGITAMGRLNGNYVGADGEKYYSDSYEYIAYDKNGNTSLHTAEGYTCTRLILIQDSEIYQVMCVEAGIDYGIYETYTGYSEQNSEYFQNLPFSVQYGIMLTSVYGWHPGKTAPISGTNEDDFAMATQTIIWEYQQQLRTSPTALQENSYGIRADNYFRTIKGRPAEKCYYLILEQMKTHATIPSFASNRSSSAEVYTLKYDSSAKNYSLTLTDTNNTLSDIQLDGSGITVTRNGNKYTFTSSNMIKDAVAVSAHKNVPGIDGNFLIWGHPGDQAAVSGAKDPVVFYVKIKTETTGVGRIVKHSEDGKVDGVRFKISGNGIDKTVTTKSDGTVDVELMPGVYTATEQTEEKYEPQKSVSLTVVSGKTTTVTFDNKLKRGSLTVTKTSEDGLSEGAKFHLSGTSLSGLSVDEYATVDKDGKAYFNNVLIGSGYTLEEVDIPERYVVPEKQTAPVKWKEVTNRSFENILKKFTVTVTKSDAEKGYPQGDASLAGAKYGIFKGDQLVDEYFTDKNGEFTTKEYICGDDWTIKELEPSEGYLIDPTVHHIGAEAKLYTVEYNLTSNDVIETVQKGNIALIKHTDNGDTQIETPEEGAEFIVYLKSAGNYDAADPDERDVIICDENGFGQTKDMPYGVYTVHQTKGWDGRELMKDFDVFIAKDGQTYRYLINNANFESYVRVVKVDAETGKTIPYAGAGFQIYDSSGNIVKMTFTYPTPTTIGTFYTDAEGSLVTPEKLPYGQGYSIVEVQAPYGYVLDGTPIYFDVAEENSTEESGVTIIKVNKANMAQKGTITVEKSGEVFFGVCAVGGVDADGNELPTIYQPQYEVQGLPSAVYEIRAAEDIITPDGTLRVAKGELAATVTTDESGCGKSCELYLGKYDVQEVTAPYGMVLNDEIHSVELVYAGQNVSVTETATSFYNERQKASVSLYKVLSQDERFQIGINSEVLSVQFGLFAAEDLTAADGSVIPADGLLEIVSCDENGNAVFTTDIPMDAKLYVKELAVDSHYILSDEKYPGEFVYAGQDIADVEIKPNNGEAINNDLIYGTIKGLKVDRETEEAIAGALFGLFHADEAEFTAEKAILTAESGEDGIFTFENIPYGNWLVKELQPAENYLHNEEVYSVTVSEHEKVIEITIVNDRIPEIGTTATVSGEKTINATEVFTLEDNVAYLHLIPGKEYTLKGVLMDKSTERPLLIDGNEIYAETVFIPDEPSGEVIVAFTFDSKYIKADTDIVVFESLYKDSIELAVHADIEDKGQTVNVKVPKIGTQAFVDGKKEITAESEIVIEDTVSYTNLTSGKEYTLKGVLMNKGTGEPLSMNGDIIRSSFTFKPEKPDGEVVVSFLVDDGSLTKSTEIVVFESLYRNGVEIAHHADIEDEGQTVTVNIPVPPAPQTGDDSNIGFWIGLGSVALGGLIACGGIVRKRKKDDEE